MQEPWVPIIKVAYFPMSGGVQPWSPPRFPAAFPWRCSTAKKFSPTDPEGCDGNL